MGNGLTVRVESFLAIRAGVCSRIIRGERNDESISHCDRLVSYSQGTRPACNTFSANE